MKSPIIFIIAFALLIPVSVAGQDSNQITIPDWIKNNVKWWADGQIDDQSFVAGIEFLVNSGIIQVKQTSQTQIDPPSLEIDAGPSDDSADIIQETWWCSGNARCFTGIVTQVIDGDTVNVDGKSIRFAMASAPELSEPRGIEAREFIETICPVGSIATVDEDDGQTQGSYGRILGVIYCNGFNLNQDLLDVGHGYLISDFCSESEFEKEYWAQKHGCNTSQPDCPTSHPYLWSDGMCYSIPESNYDVPQCDLSYPDFFLEPNIPDLDCDEIPYSNFRVYQPDPHGFDRDYDGIGCETNQSSSSSPSSSSSSNTQVDCDPSYPDFCIPPPPPDLDCGDIPQKNFTVLQPDPHRFDGDKDGIGCES